MKRREFLTRAAGTVAVLTVVPSLLAACDGEETDTDLDTDTGDGTEADTDPDTGADTDTGTDTGAADCLDCDASVAEGPSNTHGHLICLTQADLDSGADLTYTSTGGNHDHTFTITAAQLADIAAGTVVTINTSDSHPHSWDVGMC